MAPARGPTAPKQDRSRRTLEKILDAAEQLLIGHAYADVSIQDVCEAAGVSRGAFYARFRDKDALILALFERFVLEITARVDDFERRQRSRAGSLEKFVSGLIALYLDLYQHRRGLLHAFGDAARHDSALRERWHDLDTGFLERLLAEATRMRPDLSDVGQRRISDVAVPTVLAAIRAAVERPGEFGELPIHSRQALVAELTKLTFRYVGLDDAPE